MTRLSLCALTVALAAGHCLAEPSTVERAMHRFEEMEAFDDAERTTTTTTTTTTRTTTPLIEAPEKFLENLLKSLQKQLLLQETLMRQLMNDILSFLRDIAKNFALGDTQPPAITKVNEMMEMLSTRMATALQGVDELMMSSGSLDGETLRSVTTKFMKEVRVQDIVVDALFSSLRGTQTNAFLTGATAAQEKDAYAAANRAAEEFLSRMYHNLRVAGISEEDIVKFVPKPGMEGMQMRNMGKRGYGYGGYGYAYGYPLYSYGYSYPSYAYSYPYYSYSYPYYSYSSLYSYSYPYYSYGYGYPYAFGFRRLRPNSCPGCPPGPPVPVTGVSEVPMGVPPQKPVVPPFRSMGEETLGMGSPSPMGMGYTDPMMGYGMGSEYGTLEQNMGYPMDTMTGMNSIEESLYNTYGGMPAGYRNLAPMEFPGVFPESGMPTAPFGFGPIGGMPL
uniref:Gametocyte antigen 2 n=1 Tax=Eimeria nieschulzi TaxID=44416 RepID=A0A0B5JDJ5_9EIME|nr:gametocyte antigen 2 [Eimeria nieschulzi]